MWKRSKQENSQITFPATTTNNNNDGKNENIFLFKHKTNIQQHWTDRGVQTAQKNDDMGEAELGAKA